MYKYCLTHRYHSYLEDIGYNLVGQGNDNFPTHWMRDNTGENISDKNKYYDMYTFHYWLWKNELQNFDNDKWILFSTYRRFWKNTQNFDDKAKLENKIIQTPPSSWNDYEVILTEPTDLSKIKISKILKKGKKLILKKPSILFIKKKRNIQFHFDLMHLEGNLKKALDLIDNRDKKDFTYYLNNETSINLWNLFCCKSPKLLGKWYETVFDWLFKCEKIFGFKDLKDYETGRMYAYLAERYLPFWFRKYSKTRTWPIHFHDNNNI